MVQDEWLAPVLMLIVLPIGMFAIGLTAVLVWIAWTFPRHSSARLIAIVVSVGAAAFSLWFAGAYTNGCIQPFIEGGPGQPYTIILFFSAAFYVILVAIPAIVMIAGLLLFRRWARIQLHEVSKDLDERFH